MMEYSIPQVEAESGNRRFFTHKRPGYSIPNVPITKVTFLIKVLL